MILWRYDTKPPRIRVYEKDVGNTTSKLEIVKKI